jgi:uncharacterized protein
MPGKYFALLSYKLIDSNNPIFIPSRSEVLFFNTVTPNHHFESAYRHSQSFLRYVSLTIVILFLLMVTGAGLHAQAGIRHLPLSGFETRIREYIDTMKIIDNHEHLSDPVFLRKTYFIDFMLLLNHYSYDDLISSGLPKEHFDKLFNSVTTPQQKWSIIEPYWAGSFNTANNRIALLAAKKLFKIDDINRHTVDSLSRRIARAYQTDWPNHVLKDLCHIEWIIQDSEHQLTGIDNVKYVKRFSSWLNVRSKERIDSIATMHHEPIISLEDFVKSMEEEFYSAVGKGIVAVKINIAYLRTLRIENVTTEEARKVFRSMRNGNGDVVLTNEEAKPLQDYMFHKLMDLAKRSRVPVVFHTGLQAGSGNYTENSNPALLTSVFLRYPEIKFALFHGSYPFGGELSALAKNFSNVYIDMNWLYAISPSYSKRYLHEWLETVPAGKIMAFGGDFRNVENIYGELLIAREVITSVLCEKVADGYFSEKEALSIAQMILHDNASKFYQLR